MRLEDGAHIGFEGKRRRLAKRKPVHRRKQAEKKLPEHIAHWSGESTTAGNSTQRLFIHSETRGKGVEL
jgi:hypothetical protein